MSEEQNASSEPPAEIASYPAGTRIVIGFGGRSWGKSHLAAAIDAVRASQEVTLDERKLAPPLQPLSRDMVEERPYRERKRDQPRDWEQRERQRPRRRRR